MLMIVMIGTYVFTQKQMKTTLKLSYDTNETQLQQLANTVKIGRASCRERVCRMV